MFFLEVNSDHLVRRRWHLLCRTPRWRCRFG
uniref:Uncharacterized protein n=1 Tax=Setaria italica TaxID=4555 RepID=K4A3U7_SETIT